jgi:hypothetical protein
MAVIYGNYDSVLENYVSVQAVGSTDTFYFTIPWHKASTVNLLNIWNTTATNMTVDAVYITSDSAHMRYDTSDMAHILYSDHTDKTGKAAQNYFVSYPINPEAQAFNMYGRNYLEVIVVTTTSISSPKLYLQAQGKKSVFSDNVLNEVSGLLNDKSYRVLMGKNQTGTGGTGGTCYDITGVMTGRGGLNLDQAGLGSTFDYVYIGSTKKLDHWDFVLSGIGATNATLNMQYWNGSTWSSTGCTILDRTSSGSNDTLRYSGIIENKGLPAMSSLWKETRMSGTGRSLLTDPNYTYVEAINAGTIQPSTLAWDPARYWMRFSVSKVVGTGVSFAQILPVEENYTESIY